MNNLKKLLIAASLLVAVLILPNLVSAATVAEIQSQLSAILQQIQQLQQQIAQLQASGSATTTPKVVIPTTPVTPTPPTTGWCHTFNTNLKYGDTGTEITALQTALEKESFVISAAEKSSLSFLDSTASAVVGFQNKYKAEILTPLGLINGTGYVGTATRIKLNALYECTGGGSSGGGGTTPIVEPAGIVNLDEHPWPPPPQKPIHVSDPTRIILGLVGPLGPLNRGLQQTGYTWGSLKPGETKYFKFTVPQGATSVKVGAGAPCSDDRFTGPSPRCSYFPKDIVLKRGAVPNTNEDNAFLDKDFNLRIKKCINVSYYGYVFKNIDKIVPLVDWKQIIDSNSIMGNFLTASNCNESDLNSALSAHPIKDAWYNGENWWEVTRTSILNTATRDCSAEWAKHNSCNPVIKMPLESGTYYMAVSFPKRTADLVYQKIIEIAQNTVENDKTKIAQLKAQVDAFDVNAKIKELQSNIAQMELNLASMSADNPLRVMYTTSISNLKQELAYYSGSTWKSPLQKQIEEYQGYLNDAIQNLSDWQTKGVVTENLFNVSVEMEGNFSDTP